MIGVVTQGLTKMELAAPGRARDVLIELLVFRERVLIKCRVCGERDIKGQQRPSITYRRTRGNLTVKSTVTVAWNAQQL
jgi:hypothetical protein